MLGDDIDIYDDLDDFQEVETKKSKELEAWEAKYEAAQLEITNLQTENKALAKKVRIMEVNLQNLLDTAKAEIKRKDSLITQLRKEKDDICFRRKKPFAQAHTSAIVEQQQEEHQRNQKRFKQDESEMSTDISAYNNNNKNNMETLQPLQKQQTITTIPQEMNAEVKQPLRRDVCEKTTKSQRLADEPEHYGNHRAKERDRERERERKKDNHRLTDVRDIHDSHRAKARERERDADPSWERDRYKRRRSRSASPSRARCRSRERSKPGGQRHPFNVKDRRETGRSDSRSPTRLSHRTSSKTSKHHSSRETERKLDIRSATDDKEHKNTMDELSHHPAERAKNRQLKNISQSQMEFRDERKILKDAAKDEESIVKEENNLENNKTKGSGEEQKEEIHGRNAISNEKTEVCKVETQDQVKAELENDINTQTVQGPTEDAPENLKSHQAIDKGVEETTPLTKDSSVQPVVNDVPCYQHIPGLDLVNEEQDVTNVVNPNLNLIKHAVAELEEGELIPELVFTEEVIIEEELAPNLDVIENDGIAADNNDFEPAAEDVNNDLEDRMPALEVTPGTTTEEDVTVKEYKANMKLKEQKATRKRTRKRESNPISGEAQQKQIQEDTQVFPAEEQDITLTTAATICAPDAAEQENIKNLGEDEAQLLPKEILTNLSLPEDETQNEIETGKENEVDPNATLERDDEPNNMTSPEGLAPEMDHIEYPQEEQPDRSPDVPEVDPVDPEKSQSQVPSTSELAEEDKDTPLRPEHSSLSDDMVTPKRKGRSMKSIQIIEDIRLPIMMDIEDIAVKVDACVERKSSIESHVKELRETSSVVEEPKLLLSNNQPERDSKALAAVMYAQPDSTKVDHNDDNVAIEAVMNELIPDQPQAPTVNLSQEMDTIELTLKQLHQHSLTDDQPDETAVTSTSMKGGQASKQDLMQVLMQSPLPQKPALEQSPKNEKSNKKKVGARTVNERVSPSKVEILKEFPDKQERPLLKKRKLDLNNEAPLKPAEPPLPPSPPVTGASDQSLQHVTIDETFNASSLEETQSQNTSDSSLVTKRCSLGNSDYQFERVNDEVVLRVTRRRRRRPEVVINE